MNRGYFGIGIYKAKTETNVGTLWRTAQVFGASFIFTVGRRYRRQASDVMSTPEHVPLHECSDMEALLAMLPKGCPLVGIELTPEGEPVCDFSHPKRACYLLGAEDHGLTPSVLERCHYTVRLPGKHCLNVATAGSLVIYDRWTKMRPRNPAP
jgi:tRNA G18 (ribose-2'-O)-methylase SpoU